MYSKEFKVALVTLISGTLLYFGFRFLKGSDFLSRTNTYYAEYSQIDGLQVSNPIIINGLTVGRVGEINIQQNKSNTLLVSLEINKAIRLGRGSVAVLADGGLLSGKIIDLKISKNEPFLEDEDTLVSEVTKGITALMKDKAMPVLANFDSTIHTINRIVGEYQGFSMEVKKLLDGSANAMSNANRMLLSNEAKINKILSNFEKISTSLAETSQELKPLMAKMNAMADSVDQIEFARLSTKMENNLNELHKIMTSINEAEGSLGLLIKNDSLYRNMNQTMAHLDSLLIDVREKPKRYLPNISVFGGKREK